MRETAQGYHARYEHASRRHTGGSAHVEERLALARRAIDQLRANQLDDLLAPLRAAEEDRPNEPVLAEEEAAIVGAATFAGSRPLDDLDGRIRELEEAHRDDIRVEDGAAAGRDIEISLAPTSHVDACDASVGEGIVPGTQGAMRAEDGIIELSDIARRIDIRRVRSQVLVGDDAFAPLDGRLPQKGVVERQADTQADEVAGECASSRADDRMRRAITHAYLANLLAMHDIYVMARNDLIHQLASLCVERTPQPEGAAHQPGHVQSALAQPFGQVVGHVAAAARHSGLALLHTLDDLLRVIQRHEGVDVRCAIRARNIQHIRPAAAGDEQRVIGQ